MSSAPSTISIPQRIERVLARIDRACQRAGRDPETVTLIAVSKGQPASSVVEALHAGHNEFGENKVQEGLAKIEAARQLDPLAMKNATFHLIGHLQTNKARAAANAFAILHSVDSLRLLQAISASGDRPVHCMIEVNIAGEESKFGVSEAGVPALLTEAAAFPNIRIDGLMTVAPLVAKAEEARPVFRQLAKLATTHGLHSLSMGMTGDFEVAIEEGATHVRIGRAIFGERA